MAKTKISEWSTTPSSNTDIDGINIAEGCAPSGINDAIRDLMAQVRSWQSGASGDPFNGPMNGTVGATTAYAGAFTTLSASSTVTLSGGTANGVAYLNGSKVLTSGSALVFDGTNFGVGTASPTRFVDFEKNQNAGTLARIGNTTSGTGAYSALQLSSSAATYLYNFSNAYTTSGKFAAGSTLLDAGGTGGLGINAESVGIIFYTGSTEQMRLTSAGNLGLGTTSPSNTAGFSKQLQIQGSLPALTLSDTSTGTGKYTIGVTSGSLGFWDNTASAYRMFVDSSGNVGIGTGSPTTLLSLASGTATTLGLSITANGWNGAKHRLTVPSSGDTSVWSFNYSGSAVDFASYGTSAISVGSGVITLKTGDTNTAPSERARIDVSGNFIVGATSAYNPSGGGITRGTFVLDQANRTNLVVSNQTNNSSAGAALVLAAYGADWILESGAGAKSSNSLTFTYGASERARFDSSGNLLVGTTSTSFGTQGSRMLPSGQVQAVSASGNDAFAGYRQTTTAGDSIITGYSNVGGTQVLKFNAMADGNVRIAAGATYGNISDRKYKTNIVDATPKLQDLMQLRVRNFNVSGSEQKAIGFIAQEFETVFPSLVIESVDKDFDGNDLGTTTKGIKESALIPVLVKAIQEQQSIIDTLKARLDAANL